MAPLNDGFERIRHPAVRQPTRPDVDIVFVHGLDGDRESTWTNRSSKPPHFWPRDSLQLCIPRARILTYGYNSKVLGTGAGTLETFARSFLFALATGRMLDDAVSRPLIFIAHSLGGLLVELAIMMALWNTDNTPVSRSSRAIESRLIGVVEMGVPHAGATIAKYASILSTLAKTFMSSNTGLLHELQRDSPELKKRQEAFSNYLQSRGRDKLTLCCLEENVWAVWPHFHDRKIVDDRSAVIVGRETYQMLLKGNHQEMTKFGSTSDGGYVHLWSILYTWIYPNDRTMVVPLALGLAVSPHDGQVLTEKLRDSFLRPSIPGRALLWTGNEASVIRIGTQVLVTSGGTSCTVEMSRIRSSTTAISQSNSAVRGHVATRLLEQSRGPQSSAESRTSTASPGASHSSTSSENGLGSDEEDDEEEESDCDSQTSETASRRQSDSPFRRPANFLPSVGSSRNNRGSHRGQQQVQIPMATPMPNPQICGSAPPSAARHAPTQPRANNSQPSSRQTTTARPSKHQATGSPQQPQRPAPAVDPAVTRVARHVLQQWPSRQVCQHQATGERFVHLNAELDGSRYVIVRGQLMKGSQGQLLQSMGSVIDYLVFSNIPFDRRGLESEVAAL